MSVNQAVLPQHKIVTSVSVNQSILFQHRIVTKCLTQDCNLMSSTQECNQNVCQPVNPFSTQDCNQNVSQPVSLFSTQDCTKMFSVLHLLDLLSKSSSLFSQTCVCCRSILSFVNITNESSDLHWTVYCMLYLPFYICHLHTD